MFITLLVDDTCLASGEIGLGSGLVPRRRRLDWKKLGRHGQRPQLGGAGRGRMPTPHGRAHPGAAVAGPLALTGHRTTQLCRPDARDVGGSMPGLTDVLPWWAMVLTPPRVYGELDERDCRRLRGDACCTTHAPARRKASGVARRRRRWPPAGQGGRGQRTGNGPATGDWVWQDVEVTVWWLRAVVAGVRLTREVACTVAATSSFEVVVVRDPSGRM